MDLTSILFFVALGLCSGFAAGLLGIGGGLIMVPLLTLVFSLNDFPAGYVVHMAVATSLAVIFFTSIASVYAHNKKRAVLWPVALLLIPGVMIGAWVGPVIAAHLSTRYLAGLFGGLVFYSAIRMWRKKRAAQQGTINLPSAPGMTAAGFGIGTLAGLVGAGGGFVTVPFLSWRGVGIHNAVATSAVMGFPIAMFGSLSNIHEGWTTPDLPLGSLGFINLPAMLYVAAASVVSAPLGARTAHAMDANKLRTVFASLLLLLAAYMFWKAVSS